LVARAKPHILALQRRQRDDGRLQRANRADRGGDAGFRNGEERARKRRDRTDRARALCADLQQRDQRRTDDDADEDKKLSFVSIREDCSLRSWDAGSWPNAISWEAA
jgi:hypothetical protein